MTHTTQTLDDRIHELLQRIPTELFIAGQFQPAHNGATLSVTNPSDGSELATVASASEKEARAALDAAEKAQPTWAATPARERSEILRRAYDLVIEHKDDLAMIQSLELGRALPDSEAEVTYAAEFFRWFAEEAVRIRGDYRHNPHRKCPHYYPPAAGRPLPCHHPMELSACNGRTQTRPSPSSRLHHDP